jgi:hypothetical protein
MLSDLEPMFLRIRVTLLGELNWYESMVMASWEGHGETGHHEYGWPFWFWQPHVGMKPVIASTKTASIEAPARTTNRTDKVFRFIPDSAIQCKIHRIMVDFN